MAVNLPVTDHYDAGNDGRDESQGVTSTGPRPFSFATNPILTRAMGAIRTRRPPLPNALAYEVRRGYVFMGEHPGTYAQVWFRTAGCLHDRRGECTMCNYGRAAPPTAEQMVEAVHLALAEVGPVDVLYVSPSGSLLDPTEVPSPALEGILELVSATSAAEFLCETRPHTIDAARASLLVDALPGKLPSIEMGLESADPWVLRYCINKSLDLEEYQHAVAVLNAHGIRALANVLLGSPFLTEEQAIADAVNSVEWALARGTYNCVVFPSHVRQWTLLHRLWERGWYMPPSLWSLVEMLRRIGPEQVARVGISWYWQPSGDDSIVASPTTCDRCINRVLPMLHDYRAWRRYEQVERLSQIECECKEQWRMRLLVSAESNAVGRMLNVYRWLGQEFCSPGWWSRHGEALLAQCAREYEARRAPAGEGSLVGGEEQAPQS